MRYSAKILALTVLLSGAALRAEPRATPGAGFPAYARPGRAQSSGFRTQTWATVNVAASVVGECRAIPVRKLHLSTSTDNRGRVEIEPTQSGNAGFIEFRGTPNSTAFVIAKSRAVGHRALLKSERMMSSETTVGEQEIVVEDVRTTLPHGEVFFGEGGSGSVGYGGTRAEVPEGTPAGEYVGAVDLILMYP